MRRLLLGATSFLAIATLDPAARATPIDFTFTGSLVTFTVPTTDNYQILAFGAQGGNSSLFGIGAGGGGAEIGGDFTLTAGEMLQIAVGGAGGGLAGDRGGAGGGGSFVVGPGNTPLVIAGGGGGGGGAFGTPFTGQGGLTGPDGGGVGGGTGGNGGAGGFGIGGGGGGGFLVRVAIPVLAAPPAVGHFQDLLGACLMAASVVVGASLISAGVAAAAATAAAPVALAHPVELLKVVAAAPSTLA